MLIDNILITEKLHKRFQLAIILNGMSNHLPTLSLVKQTKVTDKSPLEFERRNLNEKKMSQIKHELYNVNWLSVLNGKDSSENFDIFSKIINETMNKISLIKKMRISAK